MAISGADPRLHAALECFLEGSAESGLHHFPRAVSAPQLPPPPARQATLAAPGLFGPAPPPVPAAPPPRDPARTEQAARAALAELATCAAACTRCRLAETRTHAVPGEGSPTARIMFVGEAPGADEDASGRPFVGVAGQLLTRIIESGIGIARGEVYICNVLKCRPPGNRDPEADEKESCAPFLEQQIAWVQPELIIALGRHAASQLLGTQAPLSRLRGTLHPRPQDGRPVLVTFHPAYLLRNPHAKADCWQDIQVGMRYLGLEAPSRRPS